MNADTHEAAMDLKILVADKGKDQPVIDALLADPTVTVIDRVHLQQNSLGRRIPAPTGDLLAEPTRWIHYPWRRSVVHVLGPDAFRTLRLDRNRNMITSAEQMRLGELRIGIVGLSVGHVIAHTLAAEGLCGTLRLADFDDLELSNLNRVPASLFDLGENKAVVTARRIAELDPYVNVEVVSSGLATHNIEAFLDGLDILIEECDSLDMKALVRRAARSRRLPVLMATSDRGLIDVERFDLDPARPLLHGLLGDIDIDTLAGLSSEEKIPHVLQIVDASQGSARGAASMIEVGRTISTWPQLAGDVIVCATALAEAVRRIGLQLPLKSGRVRIDVSEMLDQLHEPLPTSSTPAVPGGDSVQAGVPSIGSGAIAAIAFAAGRAPSGGNSQPWRIHTEQDTLVMDLATEHSSAMDIAFRGSAVALGAAMFNARVAAAAHRVLGPVTFADDSELAGSPLRAVLRFGDDADPRLARQYDQMLSRETNRRRGSPGRLSESVVTSLRDVAKSEGARLSLLTTSAEMSIAADILGEADRIRYLTSHLHREMVSELRWPVDQRRDTGIDVRSLELSPGALATLDILRRSDVMSQVALWDGGQTLTAPTSDSITSSAALAVITVTGATLADYARGGSAVEAVWIKAQALGLAVHPISPVFLYAHTQEELDGVSPDYGANLGRLREQLRDLAGNRPDESQVLIIRLFDATAASVRSQRRRN